jgi:hypothetical protein
LAYVYLAAKQERGKNGSHDGEQLYSCFPTLRQWPKSFLRGASATDRQQTLIQHLLMSY